MEGLKLWIIHLFLPHQYGKQLQTEEKMIMLASTRSISFLWWSHVMVGQTSYSSTEMRQAWEYFTQCYLPCLRLWITQCQSWRSSPSAAYKGGVWGKTTILLFPGGSPCCSHRSYQDKAAPGYMLCKQKREGVTPGCFLVVSPANSYSSWIEFLSVISQSTFLSSAIIQTTESWYEDTEA